MQNVHAYFLHSDALAGTVLQQQESNKDKTQWLHLHFDPQVSIIETRVAEGVEITLCSKNGKY